MRKKIVYLDDHVLYPDAVMKHVDPKKDRFLFIRFQHPDQCLKYVYNSIESNSKIDVIITDFNHPGMNGFDFSLSVRALESSASYFKPIPIILLSFTDPYYELSEKDIQELMIKNPDKDREYYENYQEHRLAFKQAVENNFFSSVLGKNSEGDDILKAILKATSTSE
jgi:CheY-like chemotaxis protein